MAIRWLEAYVKENNRHEAPTKEQLKELDCLKDLNFFETMRKILNIPMEAEKIWARRRLMPVQSQHDCMVIRTFQEAYVEAQQSVQCVSAGHGSRSF